MPNSAIREKKIPFTFEILLYFQSLLFMNLRCFTTLTLVFVFSLSVRHLNELLSIRCYHVSFHFLVRVIRWKCKKKNGEWIERATMWKHMTHNRSIDRGGMNANNASATMATCMKCTIGVLVYFQFKHWTDLSGLISWFVCIKFLHIMQEINNN